INPEKRQLLLNEGLEVDTKDFIRIKFINTEKISLHNKTPIFTSTNGVEGFFKNGFDTSFSSVICVGSKTESKLAEKGIKTLHTAKNAEELASFILQQQ
ncbi:uroporphyrinogen-III synthase, partial [Escherichia coli]|nr:uroporphyrinogen-III synthase [Escherichia coli]